MSEEKHWMEWTENRFLNPYHEHKVPWSCCKYNKFTNRHTICNTKFHAIEKNIHQKDCYDVLYDYVTEQSNIIGILMATAAGIHIICMIPSIVTFGLLK